MTVKNKRTFINGKIFTANGVHPYVEAMVVENGKITWIGKQAELDMIEGDVIDLHGQRVLPGFLDAHQHPLMLSQTSKQLFCMPPVVHSIEELVDKLRHKLEGNADGEWLEAWGYDEGKLLDRRAPTRWDLDNVSTDVPIVVTRTCTHIISVNSKALALAGITEDTPNPIGGEIERDENGVATGILKEAARDFVKRVMPTKTVNELACDLVDLSTKLLALGITGTTELMARLKPHDDYEIFCAAVDKGIRQRTVLYYMWEDFTEGLAIEPFKMCKENSVHVGGIKLFADGSVSGQTAWVDAPYLGTAANYGITTTTLEELLAAGNAAKEHGVQLVVHAMGEKAIDLIVNTFYQEERWLKNMPSVRVEHAAMPTKQALERAAQAGIAFVPQPIFLFAEIESYFNHLGEERTRNTYPVKAMLAAGIPVAFSSDAPATAWADPANPFVGIQAAVTRKAYDGSDTGSGQAIDVETAITLYTRMAQEITGIPNVGQLAVGYEADFIVLDRDILAVAHEEIGQIIVEQTYMGGELVFVRE